MDVFLTGCWRKPKATYIKLIVIIMCVSLVESAPGHRRRHGGKDANLTQTNALQNSNITNKFISAKVNITRRIGYVYNNFTKELKKLNIPTKEITGNATWLPKVNFVKIHDILPKYKNKPQQFLYIMPKIYRNLKEFRSVFAKLLNIRLKTCGLYTDYARQKLIKTTINVIDVAISQIDEAYKEVNLSLNINNSRHSVSSIQTHNVNEGKCFAQDLIAFRGFGNAMRDWHHQLKCWPSKRKFRHNFNLCKSYENRLNNRIKQKHNRKAPTHA